MLEAVVIVVVGLFLYSRVQATQAHAAIGSPAIIAVPAQGLNSPGQSLPPWSSVQDAIAGQGPGFVIINPPPAAAASASSAGSSSASSAGSSSAASGSSSSSGGASGGGASIPGASGTGGSGFSGPGSGVLA